MTIKEALFLLVAAADATLAFTNTHVDQFMRKNIDPIVYPGEYKSHMHSFFGSDAVTVNLPTSADLRNGCATAANPNDMSVYWIPTLYYVDGDKYTPMEPYSFTAYYVVQKDPVEVPIPEDFSAVAGNALAKDKSGLVPGSDLIWLCESGDFDAGGKDYSDWPQSTCPSKKKLQVVLFFPDCVDDTGKKTAYSKNTGKQCPSGMKRMPQLRFSIRYDWKKYFSSWNGNPPIQLACGTSQCFHGDFINGWDPTAMQNMVKTITSVSKWQAVDGPKGKAKAGSTCKTTAKDNDPNNGTNDYKTSLKMMAAKVKRTIGEKFANRRK